MDLTCTYGNGAPSARFAQARITDRHVPGSGSSDGHLLAVSGPRSGRFLGSSQTESGRARRQPGMTALATPGGMTAFSPSSRTSCALARPGPAETASSAIPTASGAATRGPRNGRSAARQTSTPASLWPAPAHLEARLDRPARLSLFHISITMLRRVRDYLGDRDGARPRLLSSGGRRSAEACDRRAMDGTSRRRRRVRRARVRARRAGRQPGSRRYSASLTTEADSVS
jgi:hypothetical protein